MSPHVFEGRMLIDGELCAAAGGEWLESLNPANEAPLGHVPCAAEIDVQRAVAAAASAQQRWARRSIFERGAVVKELAAALRGRAQEIVRLD